VRYEFIKAEAANGLRVARLCEALGVSRSAYYAWDGRPESERSKRRTKVTEQVRDEFHSSHMIPGSRKIAKKLSRDGFPASHKMVANIMRENNWQSKVSRKYKATTNSQHNLPVAENLLDRQFTADRPNQKWLTDLTFIQTDEGWLYLAVILDLYGREAVGWAMSSRMTKELVLQALKQAVNRRGSPRGVLHHSDRGSQYCSHDYRAELARHGFISSMSRKGNVYDNAPMESFWGKLKQEWLSDKRFRTREDAMSAVFWYIEIYYRNYRLHEANGYLTPKEAASA